MPAIASLEGPSSDAGLSFSLVLEMEVREFCKRIVATHESCITAQKTGLHQSVGEMMQVEEDREMIEMLTPKVQFDGVLQSAVLPKVESKPESNSGYESFAPGATETDNGVDQTGKLTTAVSGVFGADGSFLRERDNRSVEQIVKAHHSKVIRHHQRQSNHGRRRDQIEHVLDSAMGFIIMANLITMGISADDTGKDAKDFWKIIDACFAMAYAFELMVKIYAHGCKFFLERNWRMNLIDSVLAILGIVEMFIDAMSLLENSDVEFKHLSMLRIARLLRVARVVRLLRFPIFKDLVTMIDGVAGGANALFWSCVLVIMPLYVCALLLRDLLGHYGTETTKYFATMGQAMFTVFRCIMGDCSSDRGTPIFVEVSETYGWGYAFCYSLCVVLTNFGLFNVIAAVYVERTVVASKTNDILLRDRRLHDETRFVELSSKLVAAFVANIESRSLAGMSAQELAGMQIDRDHFKTVLHQPETKEIFNNLDVSKEDIQDADDLFDTFDADGNGNIEIGQLITGIHKLRGDPRRSDVVANGLATRAVQIKLDAFELCAIKMMGKTVHDCDSINKTLNSIRHDLEKASHSIRHDLEKTSRAGRDVIGRCSF